MTTTDFQAPRGHEAVKAIAAELGVPAKALAFSWVVLDDPCGAICCFCGATPQIQIQLPGRRKAVGYSCMACYDAGEVARYVREFLSAEVR